MEINSICCPNCHHSLDVSTPKIEVSHCSHCDAIYVERNGVIDFIPQDDFYWGEIELEKMRQINNDAEEQGNWYSSICQHLAGRSSLIKYITDPARLGWLFHCYDEKHNQACLDVGSGWGLLSFGLSRFYQSVYSIDGVYERLHFQAIRANIDGTQNIKILRSTLSKLPLQDQSVDLVVLNGVLEWIGLSDLIKKPDELQKIFLSEIGRVLKPNGVVYLGIENRFGFLYYLGDKDHSGLPYTSLVPRILANRMVKNAHLKKVVKGNETHVFSGAETEYRTYTYSLWGYKKLLKDVGFKNISAYWAWQSYSYPRMSGPLDGNSIKYIGSNLSNLIDNKWKRLPIRLALLLPNVFVSQLAKIFWPHFLIFARRQSSEDTSLERMILHKNKNAQNCVRLTLGTNTQIKTTYLTLDHKLNVSKSIRVTEQIQESGQNYGFVYQEEPGIKGRLFRPYDKDDIQKATGWLLDYQRKTRDTTWTDDDLTHEINDLIKTAQNTTGFERYKSSLTEFENKYLRIMRSIQLGVVDEHGDFTPPNIIITPENELRVIDWEHSRKYGNPLMDIGSFYLSLIRRTSSQNNFQTHLNQGSPLIWFVNGIKSQMQILVALSPSYYILRVIKRINDQQNHSLDITNALSDWTELLRISLEYSISMDDFIHQE